MINPVGAYTSILPMLDIAPVRPAAPPIQAGAPTQAPGAFGDVLSKLVSEVDSTRQAAAAETRKVLLGQSDSLHGAMLALQESSIALSMMVEVRNKLVESYQELMRMPV